MVSSFCGGKKGFWVFLMRISPPGGRFLLFFWGFGLIKQPFGEKSLGKLFGFGKNLFLPPLGKRWSHFFSRCFGLC